MIVFCIDMSLTNLQLTGAHTLCDELLEQIRDSLVALRPRPHLDGLIGQPPTLIKLGLRQLRVAGEAPLLSLSVSHSLVVHVLGYALPFAESLMHLALGLGRRETVGGGEFPIPIWSPFDCCR
jgi:hypothetical protein